MMEAGGPLARRGWIVTHDSVVPAARILVIADSRSGVFLLKRALN